MTPRVSPAVNKALAVLALFSVTFSSIVPRAFAGNLPAAPALQPPLGSAAADVPATAAAAAAPSATPIEYTEETLANGLHVIYAPLHQAPVVHLRVLYHVGSRDE